MTQQPPLSTAVFSQTFLWFYLLWKHISCWILVKCIEWKCKMRSVKAFFIPWAWCITRVETKSKGKELLNWHVKMGIKFPFCRHLSNFFIISVPVSHLLFSRYLRQLCFYCPTFLSTSQFQRSHDGPISFPAWLTVCVFVQVNHQAVTSLLKPFTVQLLQTGFRKREQTRRNMCFSIPTLFESLLLLYCHKLVWYTFIYIPVLLCRATYIFISWTGFYFGA